MINGDRRDIITGAFKEGCAIGQKKKKKEIGDGVGGLRGLLLVHLPPRRPFARLLGLAPAPRSEPSQPAHAPAPVNGQKSDKQE